MRAAKVLEVLAIAALGIAAFGAVAVAGKPLKQRCLPRCGPRPVPRATTVDFGWPRGGPGDLWVDQPPNFNSGKVSATGSVMSAVGEEELIRADPRGLTLPGVTLVPPRLEPPDRRLGVCVHRSMRLQVLDTNGVVITTLDGSTSSGPKQKWTLSGQLPTTLPAGTNYVRVKAKKRIVVALRPSVVAHMVRPKKQLVVGRAVYRKYLCQAGFSPTVAIPAA